MKLIRNFTLLLSALLLVSCSNDWQEPGKIMEKNVSSIKQVAEGYNTINLYTIGNRLKGDFDPDLRMKAGINYNSSMDSLGIFLISHNAVTKESKIAHLVSHELKNPDSKASEFNSGALKMVMHEKEIKNAGKKEGYEYNINIYNLSDGSSSYKYRTAKVQFPTIHGRPYGIQHFEAKESDEHIIRLYSCRESGGKKTNIYSFLMMMYNSGTLDETIKLLTDPIVAGNATMVYNQDYLEIPTTYEGLAEQEKSNKDYKGLPFKNYQ